MSAAEFIDGIKSMSQPEREKVFATLIDNQEWREDLLDLITLAERCSEPTEPIDEVFKDLRIDA